jgi:lysophospholipase L1-like esterase
MINLLKKHLVVFLCLVLGQSVAQTKQDQNLIEESQAGASPLYFFPNELSIPLIQPSNFDNPNEFKVRDGLPYFFKKLKSNKKVTVGYLGGSITRADNQYRVQSIDYIQDMYPKVKVVGINAGVSGTGTDLGASRLYEQLLKYEPDLIFVEFAVNGAFAEGMEGIIRQIRKYNPKIDICLIYTISTGLSKIYAKRDVPKHIRKLELLAEHYAIPSIHMGLEASYLEKKGKLIWKGTPDLTKDKILFSEDGVHPLEAGGNLYAAAIARAFLQFKKNTTIKENLLPTPLFSDNWEDAKMFDPKQIASFEGEWQTIDPSSNDNLNQFSGWFPYLFKADKPGASFSFKFEGNMFGLFDIGGPEVGQLKIELDGKLLYLKKTKEHKLHPVK